MEANGGKEEREMEEGLRWKETTMIQAENLSIKYSISPHSGPLIVITTIQSYL